MKNLLIQCFFIASFCFIGNQAIGQKFMMENEQISYDDRIQTSVKVIMQPSSSEVRKEWEDWLEDRFDTKVSGNGFFRNKDVLTSENVLIPSISNGELNVYAKIVKKGNGTQMNIFATLKGNQLIVPTIYPKEYRALENLALDFSSDLLVEYYRDRVSDSQEAVADLQEKRNDLKEDLSENLEEIVKLKQENIELEKKLTTKGGQIETAAEKLENEKEKLKKLNKKLEAEKKENQ